MFFKKFFAIFLSFLFSVFFVCSFSRDLEVFAVDEIEPGSPQAFFKYVSSGLELWSEYANGDLFSSTAATISYAWDMRSLFVAYSVWLDNQSFSGATIPSWTTCTGFIRIIRSGESAESAGIYPLTFTGVNNYFGGNYYNMPEGAMFFVDFPLGMYMSPVSQSQPPQISVRTDRYNLSFTGWSSNWLSGTAGSVYSGNKTPSGIMKSVPASGGYNQVTFPGSDSPSIPLLYAFGDVANATPTPITLRDNDDFISTYEAIRDSHPDIDPQFEFPFPLNNEDWDNQQETTEPDSHPSGCCCCQCFPSSGWDYEFPSFPSESTEFILPSDLPLETFPNFTEPSIPEHILDKAAASVSVWYSLFDIFLDSFNLRWLIYLMLFAGLVLYIIVR